MAVYRVPVRAVFNRKRTDKTITWDSIYGKMKCLKCLQHFKEGEPYRTVGNDGKTFEHIDCPEKPKRKKGVG